jgi:hypothetical protein
MTRHWQGFGLAVGTNVLTATYLGDANHQASTSAPLNPQLLATNGCAASL